MADSNLSAPAEPDVTTPPTQEQLVEDISELLDAPTEDHVEENEDAPAAEPEDDPLGLEAEDVAEDQDAEPDGPDAEIKGGRFAPDTAKVKLDDGTTITIAELKRNNLYQRGFTEKTTALAKDREALEAERKSVAEYAQSLAQSRDYLAWYAEQFVPKQPEPFKGAPDDYVGFLQWQQENSKWAAHAEAFQQFQQQKQAEDERLKGETQKQAQARQQREAQALLNALPVLKDKTKGPLLWQALVNGAGDYGFTADEFNSLQDHRYHVVLRDALAYRRLKAKAPEVKDEVARKPVKPGRRTPPTTAAVKQRQAQTERLRNSGSLNDFVAAASHLFE